MSGLSKMAAFLVTRVFQIVSPPLTRGMRGQTQHIKFMKSLDQKLQESRKAFEETQLPEINIGFPHPSLEEIKKNKEKNVIVPDIGKIRQNWQNTSGIRHIRMCAQHYGIYRDMFSNAYFYPVTPLQIFYYDGSDYATPVFNGNRLKPAEMKTTPEIEFQSDPESLWTLLATNLDCHFEKDSFEYLLWMVGNIRGNDISTGETICDYLQPFPAKGLGYQRVVFILYKQDKLVDYKSLRRETPCLSLKARTFLTYDFYKEYQSSITPSGLAFCQVDWDESMTEFFHHVLKMREPRFEYDHRPMFIKPQIWNPHKRQFDTYLDKYRPLKELAEEVLLMRLKNSDPFRQPEQEKFPLVHPVHRSTATWVKKQLRQQHLRWAKYRDL